MLPSQSRQKNYIHNNNRCPIGDGMLSRGDTLNTLDGMTDFTNASEPITAPVKNNYWRVEKLLNEKTVEYCKVGSRDCGKSCPVIDCVRNFNANGGEE
jgi:hypothetical protein